METIIIENLTKKYGSFTALKEINAKVKQGDTFGFIGPNGAGKSTTIRVLLGLLRKNSGRVTVLNKDPWLDALELHRKLAYVPSDVTLWPNLTGGEVIDFLGRLRGPVDAQRKKTLLNDFGLDPKKKCKTYSKGNRQKVTLISAFISEVDLLVLDEPTSGLDPLMEDVFQHYVLEQKQKGKTVFLSSHILSEVENLCDTICIIREGTIVDTGSMKQLRHLTHNTIQVEFKESIPNLSNLHGVSEMKTDGKNVTFNLDPAYSTEALKQLSQSEIKNLTSTPPTLETIFMKYYQK